MLLLCRLSFFFDHVRGPSPLLNPLSTTIARLTSDAFPLHPPPLPRDRPTDEPAKQATNHPRPNRRLRSQITPAGEILPLPSASALLRLSAADEIFHEILSGRTSQLMHMPLYACYTAVEPVRG